MPGQCRAIAIERGAKDVSGVEVKAAATVAPADYRGPQNTKRATEGRFASGVVICGNELTGRLGDGMHAVPYAPFVKSNPPSQGRSHRVGTGWR